MRFDKYVDCLFDKLTKTESIFKNLSLEIKNLQCNEITRNKEKN